MTLALRYRRVSSIGQEDNSSLEKQQDRIDEYCLLHGYETTEDTLYTEVMTGVETWRERPELNKMLVKAEMLAKGNDVVVVCDHPDRMARGLDLVLLVELIGYYNARVEFVQTKFADTDEGKLVLHLESYSSKKEWSRIKKRTHDGVLDRVIKDHRLLGSIPLYGYKWDHPQEKNRYVFNDDIIHTDPAGKQWSERSVVEYIFQKVKEGMTLGRIAQSLNDLGIPTRQRYGNSQWYSSRIGEMLGNPKYMGKYYAFQKNFTRKGDKYTRLQKPLEEQVLMPADVCPAIVDPETWEAVQAQLDYNKKNSIRNARFPEMALCRNGYARCAYCGGAMNFRGDNRRGGSFRYFCIKAAAKKGCTEHNTASTKIVDEAVWKRCCQIIRNPSKLKESIEALKTPDPTEKQSIPLDIRRKQIEEDIESLIEMGVTIKSEKGKKKVQSLLKIAEDDLEEIERKEKILEAIRSNWQKAADEIKKFETWCVAMREHLDDASYSQKRTCVEYLGIRVKIFKYGTLNEDGKPLRLIIDVAPPNILEALSGMKKKGDLTLNSQGSAGIAHTYSTLHRRAAQQRGRRQ